MLSEKACATDAMKSGSETYRKSSVQVLKEQQDARKEREQMRIRFKFSIERNNYKPTTRALSEPRFSEFAQKL